MTPIRWVLGLLLPKWLIPVMGSPFIPQNSGMILGATCLLQFGLSKWLDSHYDRGLGRNYYWMIWYPFVFWVINIALDWLLAMACKEFARATCAWFG